MDPGHKARDDNGELGFAVEVPSGPEKRLTVLASSGLVVLQGAPAGALQVLELAAVERPQEGRQPDQAEQQRARDQPGERRHRASSRRMALSRTALAVTAIEEA